MKQIITILLFGSCAFHPPAPDWVRNVASGEERMVLTNGEKLLYRQLEHSCALAIRRIERAVSKNYEVAPVLEIEYRGQDYCAVTMSIPAKSLKKSYKPVAKIGMSIYELRKKIGPVYVSYDYREPCWQEFNKAGFSYHGDYVICWKQLRINGIYEVP